MKTKFFLSACFVFLFHFAFAVPAITISHPSAGNSFCAGDTIQVRFTYSGFPITTTVFTADLMQGASTLATNTITVSAANGSVMIVITIPAGTAQAANYKVKISNDQNSTTATSGNFTINAKPTLTTNPTAPSFCAGSSVSITASGASTYTWSPSTGLNPTTGATVTANPVATSTYTIIGTSAAGCTKSLAVTVTLNPTPATPTPTSNSPVCTGTTLNLFSNTIAGVTYFWTGPNTFTSSLEDPSIPNVTTAAGGIYSVHVVSAAGCTGGTATTTVTVNPGPTVSAGGAVPAICQGATTGALGGSFGGSATSAVWSASPATGSFSNNGGATPGTTTYTASAGSTSPITLTLTTSGGSCGSVTASKTVTVNQNPTVSAGGAIPAICQSGTTIALGGSFGGGATGAVWSASPATGSFSNNGGTTPGTATYTASAGSTSPITLTLTTSGGSCGSVTGSKTVTVNQSPTVSAGGVVTAICQGATTGALGGSFGGSATSAVWSASPATGSFSNNGGSTPGTATYTASAGSTSPITLTLTTSGGLCGSVTASKTVTVNQNPTVNAGGALSAICQGATTGVLGGSFGGGATGAVWSASPATGSFSNNGGSTPGTATYTASAGSTSPITLTLTTSGGLCGSVTANKTVTVNPTPVLTVDETLTTICLGQQSSTITVTGANTYAWSPIAGLNVGTGDIVIATPNATTTYTIIGTSALGCTKNITAPVSVVPLPTLTVTPHPAEVCSGNPSLLVAVSTGVTVAASFDWQPPTGLNTTSGDSVIATLTNLTSSVSSQTYSVVGTSNEGCTVSNDVTVVIDPLPTMPIIGGPNSICSLQANVLYTISNGTSSSDSYAWTATPVGINGFITAGTHDTCLVDFSGLNGSVTACVLSATIQESVHGCKSIGIKNISISGQAPPLEPVIEFSNNPFTLAVLYSQSGTNYLWGRDSISNFADDTVGFNNEFGNQNLQLFLVPDTNVTPLHFDKFYYWVEYFNVDINCKQKAYYNIDSSAMFQSLSGIQNKLIDSKNYFFIYPNPTDGVFTVQFNSAIENQKDHLFIYDLSGKEMENQSVTTNRLLINADRKYPPGIYFVKYINHVGGCQISKIIIQ